MGSSRMALSVLMIVVFATVGEAQVLAPDPECYEDDPMGRDYRGYIAVSESGRECMYWTAQDPHVHNRTEANYPDTGLGDHNYCRNPDDEPLGPWCYTTDPDKRYEYCNVGLPSRDCNAGECHADPKEGLDYRGVVNMTAHGLECQKWSEQSPHQHDRTNANYPYTGVGDHNYCRNPDNEPCGPWCFTSDPDIRWAYCDIGPASRSCDTECYTDPMGKDYRGKINVTPSGRECQYWTEQEPHMHNRTREFYPNTGVGEHNYCRDPDQVSLQPWCYTTDPDVRYEYCDVGLPSDSCEENKGDRDYWNEHGKESIDEALEIHDDLNNNIAKNVIIMIGDGMDLTTVTAARIFEVGEAGQLSFEQLPHAGMAKTYDCNSQVPDSGAAHTAIFSGVKPNSDTLGVDCYAEYNNCSSLAGSSVYSILDDMIAAGKSTGFITTGRVTGPAMAALYGHTVNRAWEYEVPAGNAGCEDLASQFIQNAAEVNVVMGGGRDGFLPSGTRDPEYRTERGKRTDGRNLVREWLNGKSGSNAEYIWNIEQFADVDCETTDCVLGLFEPDNMKYESERGGAQEPSLATMAKKAIKILEKNENGYFLVVHAARIDDAHHEGRAYDALFETCSLCAAVQAMCECVDDEETLVVVTADHAQSMSMTGYASRGNPILGLNDKQLGDDGLPFTTLQYSAGPGGILEAASYSATGARRNLTGVTTGNPMFVYPALVPLEESNHGGQDVPIYAKGPLAHLFHNTHEQTYISHVMKKAACVGEYASDCSRRSQNAKYRKVQP